MKGFEVSNPIMIIVKALFISFMLSSVMMLLGLGFMRLLSGTGLDVSLAVLLVVFAVSFIAASVLLDRMSDDLAASFMGGAAVALSVTIFVVALVSGVYFLLDRMPLPGMDALLTGFAICLIVSLVINRLTLKI
ncbi:hypothetical protein [Methanocella conradii]|uniref:hypothetical protein n=1 Tax=Methanocella conradii TaxID=1175444 RepID=UPI0024B3AF38|nr:hypothetical protein [Methanocella conradii]MDI6895753.1 hypothetical protein [Methanocella conradii]